MRKKIFANRRTINAHECSKASSQINTSETQKIEKAGYQKTKNEKAVMSNASSIKKRKSSIKSCIAMHRKVEKPPSTPVCRKRLVFFKDRTSLRQGRSQSQEVKKKKKFRAHERPALRHGRKTMRSVEICSTSLANSAAQSRNAAGEQKHKLKHDHMTAQEPCSAVAMTLAGGDAEAEAVVQEDPAVLRLRRAMPLPPAMGIA